MKKYQRHSRLDIAIHWFNAVLWILLMFTGLALFKPELSPLGGWYPQAVRSLTGGGGNLLLIHEILGGLWIMGLLFYLIRNFRGARFFLRRVFTVDLPRDVSWMFKKMVLMTLGEKPLRALGMNPELPPQGFYNMGQKAFAQAAVFGGLGLAVTGLIMVWSQFGFSAETTIVVSWAILLHWIFAALTFAGLLVHVYMAAISPEERPGFRSMFTGWVPEDYAAHHHALWHEEIRHLPAGEDGVVPQRLDD
ncbi:Di-heme cytochrome, transmembrane [Alkalidesulfovibrio alkalitolerans DSM 16529]|jgi:formate dehydrogenase subunit gamma|uniref:Di-heme cytochrome, transmembrane n=1 Tax=Alkalidesulfovibrio alkalitolerans DSM 16529 TaxID=1121439 RepID=S7T712_9BACT|nr:cytochrome b/b6 domain-containing protein [Alkalidesulfovibrio alkalitolerans]EPR32892.1 Di-heme cytochrome, transmembrane [Alkalidesulfovibrio alkalitolerans DSM 16529]